jgi:saccharopine dehydrogenase (NAD+, L-glutamate forming)
MKSLDQKASDAGVLIMNEIGVDPGIDHMSACRIMDQIREKKGEITSFKSFCGGLIAPESDNNPWNYKFTWNPRNVVLAGQGTAAAFIKNNQYKYIPYNQLFERIDRIEIEGYGVFEGYANRNSLSYRPVYHLETIPTIYRGTLRREGFCKAWNVLVSLGMTDDSYSIEGSENLTPRTFLNTFLPYSVNESISEKFERLYAKGDKDIYSKFEWLGFFENNEVMGLVNATPAQLLEKILVGKWVLEEGDKDMLVMHHEFEYLLDGKKHQILSSMVNIGENQIFTSMSNTVGLPVAICAKMILNNEISLKGVQVPVMKEVYQPVLNELELYGITFVEKEIEL